MASVAATAPAPLAAAMMPATGAAGARSRTAVRLAGAGTSIATSPPAQPAQRITAATSCTAPLRPSNAAPNAASPATATRTHDARSNQTGRKSARMGVLDLPTVAGQANV